MPAAIVYVPGWGSDADYFADVIPLVDAEDQRVVDLAGARSLDEMVERVRTSMPPGGIALVGMSMGGWVAQAVAARAPERVERLIVGSTWSSMPERFRTALQVSVAQLATGSWGQDVRAELAANFSPRRRAGELPDRLMAMLERLGMPAVRAQAEAMLSDPDVTGTSARIDAPTLVLAAQGDVTFTATEQRELARALIEADRATVGFEVVPDAAHHLSWERPDRLAGAVRRWCLGSPSGFDATARGSA